MKKFLFVTMVLIALLAVAACGQPIPEPVPVRPVGPVGQAESSKTFDYENITKLVIQPGHKYTRLQPGDTRTFTFEVSNPTDKEVTVQPEIVQLPYSEYWLQEDWMNISVQKSTLSPNTETEIKVEVEVPEDAEMGHYSCRIALTNDTFDYPGYPVKYINAISLSVNVWVPPQVTVYPKYVRETVEAGESHTYTIMVENKGDDEVNLDPKIHEDDIYYSPYRRPTGLTEDMVTIDSPPSVSPGSKAEVKVKVDIPSDTKGSLRGSIDLGIDDPTIKEHMQKVRMNLRVYYQPSEPYVKEVAINNASKLKFEVSASNYRSDEGDFTANIISPTGHYNIEPTKTVESVGVTLSDEMLPPWEDAEGIYRVTHYEITEVYSIDNPEDGNWKLEVMPKCERFTVNVEVE